MDKRRFLHIRRAWEQVSANNMRGAWKRILRHCANGSDFKEEIVIKKVTNTEREL
jgi:hypothetical protein